jgi:glycosyltransferase involved in cell wall biosynthesis
MALKKVLIISYYWPPSGGIGVLRNLKFVKYLRNFDWEPIVFVPENADYPYLDEGNFRDIPDNVQVIKYPIREPFRLFKILTNRKNTPLNNIVHVKDKQTWFDNLAIWIRGNFFIPDARALWIKPSVRYLVNYLRENPVDAILTDGPPHTNTVIGTQVAQKTGIPYLADFQDPWTQVDYYKLFKIGKRADRIHKKLEQETFHAARKITIASPTWKKDLMAIGAKDVEVIYYGYDEDDFAALKVQPDAFFTFTHAGLLGTDRNPDNFLQAFAALNQELPGFKEFARIKLIGQIDHTVLQNIQALGLQEQVIQMGTLPRKQTLQELVNSWVLLLPLNKADNVGGRMPGKFYEYIRANRPVMSLGPTGTDIEYIMKQYELGENFSWEDTRHIKEFMQRQYHFFQQQQFKHDSERPDYSVFSNFNQTKKLAGLLHEITTTK